MNRAEAQAAVAPFIQSIPQDDPQYPPAQGVAWIDVTILLGERASKLQADRIRCHGPKPGFIYPWNVVDYLDEATKLGA